MEIKNAKIENVIMRLDSKNRLIVSMEFHDAATFVISVFKAANPLDINNLTKLMEFTEVQELNGLEGKIIRVAEHEDIVRAIGHPIEDRFVDITNTNPRIASGDELTETKLFEEYIK